MQKGPFKNYGFTYEYEGSSFVFHIVASSEEEAIGRAKAMACARFEGELKEAVPESDLRAQFERAKKDCISGRYGDAMQGEATEVGRPAQTLRSGWEVVPHNIVQSIAHRRRLWVLGLAELPGQPAESAAVGLLESFGLAWKILLWGIRQSIRAGAPR